MSNTHHGIALPRLGRTASPVRTAGASRLATGDTAALLLALVAVCVLLARAVWGVSGDPVTSDESLYLSEAVSIADGRLEYASGDPITHRPPLYPAMLAPVMAVSGNSVDATRAVPIALAIGALAALYWLGRITIGHRAACAG